MKLLQHKKEVVPGVKVMTNCKQIVNTMPDGQQGEKKRGQSKKKKKQKQKPKAVQKKRIKLCINYYT